MATVLCKVNCCDKKRGEGDSYFCPRHREIWRDVCHHNTPRIIEDPKVYTLIEKFTKLNWSGKHVKK